MQKVYLYIYYIIIGNLRNICLSNRAFAHIKMENYGLAIIDADEIIKNDPTFIKAYYRKGSAFMLLGKFDEAKKEFTRVFIYYIIYRQIN